MAKIAVITGNAYGSAYVSLASTAAGGDFCFAWENAVIAPTSPEAAVTFLNGAASAEDTAKAAKEYAEKVTEEACASIRAYAGSEILCSLAAYLLNPNSSDYSVKMLAGSYSLAPILSGKA